jgi:hypothetical protein
MAKEGENVQMTTTRITKENNNSKKQTNTSE